MAAATKMPNIGSRSTRRSSGATTMLRIDRQRFQSHAIKYRFASSIAPVMNRVPPNEGPIATVIAKMLTMIGR